MSAINNDSNLGSGWFQPSDSEGVVSYYGRKVSRSISFCIEKITCYAKLCLNYFSYYFHTKPFSQGSEAYKSGGADRFYQSQASTKLRVEYHSWLKKQLTSEKYKSLISTSFLNSLQTTSKEEIEQPLDSTEAKASYQNSLKGYRSAIGKLLLANQDLTHRKQNILDFFKEWAHWRMRDVDLLPQIQAFTNEKAWIPKVEGPLTLKEWKALLTETDKKLRNDYSLRESGPMKDLYDPHLFGNTPYKAYDLRLNSGKDCRVLRIPAVTRDLSVSRGKTIETKVIEEFQAFATALADKGERHLYVNLMKRQGALNEVPRTKAIEEMDTKEGSPISVISLDKNSDFYAQKRSFSEGTQTIDIFKQSYMDHLLSSGHCYWPSQMKPTDIKEILGQSFDTVAMKYFKGVKELDVYGRRNFIELHYSEIIMTFANRLNVDSMNTSCKDCIDRGATQLFELWLKENISSGKQFSKEEANRLTNLLFAPALMASNRPPQEDRIQRSLEMIAHLEENKA